LDLTQSLRGDYFSGNLNLFFKVVEILPYYYFSKGIIISIHNFHDNIYFKILEKDAVSSGSETCHHIGEKFRKTLKSMKGLRAVIAEEEED